MDIYMFILFSCTSSSFRLKLRPIGLPLGLSGRLGADNLNMAHILHINTYNLSGHVSQRGVHVKKERDEKVFKKKTI